MCRVWMDSTRGLAITVYPSLMTPSLRRGRWKGGLGFDRKPVPHHFLAFWVPSVNASPLAYAFGFASSLTSLLFPLQRLVRCPVEKLRWAFGPRTSKEHYMNPPYLLLTEEANLE